MKTFYKLLGIALLVATTNNFVWFALTFWIYTTTKSVISTSTLSGIWLVLMAVSNFWFGSLVDNYKKKYAMVGSSVTTLVLFLVGLFLYNSGSEAVFASVSSTTLWIFALVLMSGVIAGSVYQIAVPTLVAFIVPEKMRDRANGMFGTVMGVSFAITSVASGLVLSRGGMWTVLVVAVVATAISAILVAVMPINERGDVEGEVAHTPHSATQAMQDGTATPGKRIDVRGTLKAINAVPGLLPLILFTTINNFLGGVFMALMDAYGLSLLSIQNWGLMLGMISPAFILGGLYISKRGLGDNPLAKLFLVNTIMWVVCIFFTVQPWVVLLGVGMITWMFLVPFVEAVEQTIFQKVIPKERLGRVFGFAHSIEQAASPVTAFMIGPLTQIVFIPFMTTGRGVELIGSWFGVGTGRGIALVFITAGLVGLVITRLARGSRYYYLLERRYLGKK